MDKLPAALQHNPILSTWIRFEPQKIVLHTGKVELGQGITTAIAMIGAEELDVDITQVQVITGRTDAGPNEFITAGSMSIESSGLAMRYAAAEVRGLLIARAAASFGIDAADLRVERGVILHPDGNERISYWQLLNDAQLDVAATGHYQPKSPQAYQLIGRSVSRLDLREKILGGRPFLQDLSAPDLHHARVVRPPTLGYTLQEIDRRSIELLSGIVNVIVDGSFVGVVATDEISAIAGKKALEQNVLWQRNEVAPNPSDIGEYLRSHADTRLLVEQGTPTDTPVPEILTRENGVRVRSHFLKPYHLHGAIGPSAAFAEFNNNKLTVHSHSQGPEILQHAIAEVLGLAPADVCVLHRENAGCYGHNGADDAAMDAALLAFHTPGVPILLQWHREDEHRWEPFSPATAIDMDATVVAGRIACWNADIYSQSHSGRPRAMGAESNLIAAWHKSEPMPRPPAKPGRAPHGGIHRNADPYYDIDACRITKNLVSDQRVRTSSTRSLGAFANVFAIETFMDELALATGSDPLAFRLRHLTDPRAIDVLSETARRLEQFEFSDDGGWSYGKGLAFARYKNTKTYAAVGVALRVNQETFRAQLIHVFITADAGQIIDRDGLANQIEGGMIQAASWTLKESVHFDADGIPGEDWDSYPILTFPEIPTVDVVLLDHPDQPSLGAGEATAGPTPAAISNAIFNATSLRVRDIPFTPERLRTIALN